MTAAVDPARLAVLRELLIAIVRDMRTTMIRTAHSSVITEGHDFSCALLDGAGELIAQSEDSPAHIFPLARQARLALAHFGGHLDPGDVVIGNDPYQGGTHLNDVALIQPLFAGGRRIAFAVVRGHLADIGGNVPGSISGGAREIYQEGLRIPFAKLIAAGRPVRAIGDLIRANVRLPEASTGDLEAMRACLRTGAARLEALRARVGTAALGRGMAELLALGERRMRAAIAALPAGRYGFEDYFDGDPHTGESVFLRLTVTVAGDRLDCDFSGSAAQVPAPLNCGLTSTETGVFTALKALLDPKSPINGGAFRPIRVTAPMGTIVNAQPPAACGGFGEMRRRIESVTMGALAAAAPANIAGDTKGTSNHVLIGATNPTNRRATVFYEWPAGGTGGFFGGDGSSAMRAYDEGDFGSILPVELVEREHALMVERCELRPDSGGAGQFRGGLGLRRDLRLLAETGVLSVLSDRNRVPPFGVCNGQSGAPNRFRVWRDGAFIAPSEIPGKITGFRLQKGDRLIVETAGGGGYGDARLRAPEAIADDLRQGYVSPQAAAALYGPSAPGGELRLRVVAVDHDRFAKGCRLIGLAPSDLRRLGWSEEGPPGLLELVNPRGAPLRAWAVAARQPAGTVSLGPMVRSFLALDDNAVLAIRPLSA